MPCWLTAKVLTPGLAIFGRPGDEAEAGDHVAVDDIVVGAAGDLVALAGQDLELIAEIAFAFGGVVEFGLVEVARPGFRH